MSSASLACLQQVAVDQKVDFIAGQRHGCCCCWLGGPQGASPNERRLSLPTQAAGGGGGPTARLERLGPRVWLALPPWNLDQGLGWSVGRSRRCLKPGCGRTAPGAVESGRRRCWVMSGRCRPAAGGPGALQPADTKEQWPSAGDGSRGCRLECGGQCGPVKAVGGATGRHSCFCSPAWRVAVRRSERAPTPAGASSEVLVLAGPRRGAGCRRRRVLGATGSMGRGLETLCAPPAASAAHPHDGMRVARSTRPAAPLAGPCPSHARPGTPAGPLASASIGGWRPRGGASGQEAATTFVLACRRRPCRPPGRPAAVPPCASLAEQGRWAAAACGWLACRALTSSPAAPPPCCNPAVRPQRGHRGARRRSLQPAALHPCGWPGAGRACPWQPHGRQQQAGGAARRLLSLNGSGRAARGCGAPPCRRSGSCCRCRSVPSLPPPACPPACAAGVCEGHRWRGGRGVLAGAQDRPPGSVPQEGAPSVPAAAAAGGSGSGGSGSGLGPPRRLSRACGSTAVQNGPRTLHADPRRLVRTSPRRPPRSGRACASPAS